MACLETNFANAGLWPNLSSKFTIFHFYIYFFAAKAVRYEEKPHGAEHPPGAHAYGQPGHHAHASTAHASIHHHSQTDTHAGVQHGHVAPVSPMKHANTNHMRSFYNKKHQHENLHGDDFLNTEWVKPSADMVRVYMSWCAGVLLCLPCLCCPCFVARRVVLQSCSHRTSHSGKSLQQTHTHTHTHTQNRCCFPLFILK